jgi:4-hydroxy-tetrahydrodipicolinate reductase
LIKVIVAGASGRMGREVVKAVWNAEDMELVGAVDGQGENKDIGTLMETGKIGINIDENLEELLNSTRPDVAVDFTCPDSVYPNTIRYLENGIRPVVGTTGMNQEQISRIIGYSKESKTGGLIAPNFAISALLMIKFAAETARYLPQVEIIEMHHDGKLDAPSGTAIKTAEAIIEQRGGDICQGSPAEVEKIAGARGAEFSGGIRIHSVRLAGLVAHQEVIFGGLGQTLTIRQDSINRESFMPGVLLGIRKTMHLERVVYGLEKLLFE